MHNLIFKIFPSEYLAAFCAFLRSEFSEENIDFWLACEDFKSTASPDDLQWKAEEIYNEFIQPSACREVSFSKFMMVGRGKTGWIASRQ